jgi:hypothetical protein
MCYRVRQQQSEAEAAALPPTPGLDRVRPRWIAAAVAVLAAGWAVAALVAPPTPVADATVKEPAALAPIAARQDTVPLVPVVETAGLPADDGVPTSTDTTKAAGLGHCNHGM